MIVLQILDTLFFCSLGIIVVGYYLTLSLQTVNNFSITTYLATYLVLFKLIFLLPANSLNLSVTLYLLNHIYILIDLLVKIACHMEWDPDCKLWVGNLAEEGNRYGVHT